MGCSVTENYGAPLGLGHRQNYLFVLWGVPNLWLHISLNFRESDKGEVQLRRIHLPRTPVNRVGRLGMAAKEENWSIKEVARRLEANSLLSGRFFFVILCNQEGTLIG